MQRRNITPAPPQPDPARAAWSIDEAAKALGIGRTLLCKLIREGKIKAVKVERRTLIPADEPAAFLNRLQAKHAGIA